jgi:hypothetical protein
MVILRVTVKKWFMRNWIWQNKAQDYPTSGGEISTQANHASAGMATFSISCRSSLALAYKNHQIT